MLPFVSLIKAQCQVEMPSAYCAFGQPTGTCLRNREKALQPVPRKGLVDQGIGPSCSHGRLLVSIGMPHRAAHS